MGMGSIMMLDLNDKQRDAILDIQRDMQKQNWKRMGDMMTLRNQLQDILRSDNPDPEAAGKVFDKMSALRKQMFMDQIKERNKVMNKLNKEQRQQLRQYGGPWMMQ
jgi:Spy/CpxP family protein refolding chaperone